MSHYPISDYPLSHLISPLPYLDRYEVTNSQFKKFLAKNPQWRQDRIPARYHNGNYLKHWNSNKYPEEFFSLVDRLILDAILYLLWAGCAWRALPQEFGLWQTVYDRFAE
ncbi:MAG: transposase [Acidobacteriota bacterium]|nr:transposase [Acidobacteriota bacterium]